ncbi:sensor histidine kinase [Pseudonocardia alaniniphila]|uniref:histidine kinase n=1 Tax=Pseudonocardia alaniniphila TaxID=75291 RepID=A0ABS9TC49_9PSEU|nr:HAMP domain-containing sensor histidine kinase [Pseudonocardia alaniniphila]MCH6166099.1 HAMP domain-containing histidine kinase [Pseudonocardia alaniniphila]
MSGRFTSRLSVRLRATLAATAIVAVALGVVSVALVSVLRGSLQDSAAAEATRRAAITAERLADGSGAAGAGSPGAAVDPDVVIIGEPPTRNVLVVPKQWTPSATYTVVSKPVDTAAGKVLVQARASLQPVATALATLWSVLLPGIPALLLLVAGLTWLAVGRALAPVSAIRQELADITASDLHRRVPVPPARDEIARLAATTNRTLDRLEHAVGRHRQFVADAAHELRSPLAVLRARLEIAPPQALTAEALTDVDRIQRLTTDLLLLARLDADEPAEHEEVDLGQVAAEEASRARSRTEVGVSLDISSEIVVNGSCEQLRRVVANLVDNAVRHARTAVVVRLVRCGGDAVLEVDDDGPGIPPEHREAVFDRFTRLDEARARDAGGSGLGLAIARDIAVRHGGTIAVVDGPAGASLRARIPLRRGVPVR